MSARTPSGLPSAGVAPGSQGQGKHGNFYAAGSGLLQAAGCRLARRPQHPARSGPRRPCAWAPAARRRPPESGPPAAGVEQGEVLQAVGPAIELACSRRAVFQGAQVGQGHRARLAGVARVAHQAPSCCAGKVHHVGLGKELGDGGSVSSAPIFTSEALTSSCAWPARTGTPSPGCRWPGTRPSAVRPTGAPCSRWCSGAKAVSNTGLAA